MPILEVISSLVIDDPAYIEVSAFTDSVFNSPEFIADVEECREITKERMKKVTLVQKNQAVLTKQFDDGETHIIVHTLLGKAEDDLAV